MTVIEIVPIRTQLETREFHWINTLNPDLNILDTKLSRADIANIRAMDYRKVPHDVIRAQYRLSRKYLLEILRGRIEG